jgi:hypothetical protein
VHTGGIRTKQLSMLWLFPSLKFPGQQLLPSRRRGNREEGNNGYVVFKLNINELAGN